MSPPRITPLSLIRLLENNGNFRIRFHTDRYGFLYHPLQPPLLVYTACITIQAFEVCFASTLTVMFPCSLKRPRTNSSLHSVVKRREIQQPITIPRSLSLVQFQTSVPDIVIKQACNNKSHLIEVLGGFNGPVNYLSSNNSQASIADLGTVMHPNVPMVLLLFSYSHKRQIGELLNRIADNRCVWLGVTPNTWGESNDMACPIVLDPHGQITKSLGLLDPLGGGVYPIDSLVVFSAKGDEIIRIRLGYDLGLYYDSTGEDTLDVVIHQALEYALNIC